jgi:hypothetical protein
VCGMILRRRFYAVFVEAEDLGLLSPRRSPQSSEDTRRRTPSRGDQRFTAESRRRLISRLARRFSSPSARKESRGMMCLRGDGGWGPGASVRDNVVTTTALTRSDDGRI